MDTNSREYMAYCFARSIYHRRHEKTPIRGVTWAERFQELFGEDYDEYVERMRRESASQKPAAGRK